MMKKLTPLMLGWVISIWLPVPGAIRSAAMATISTLRFAIHSVVSIVEPDRQRPSPESPPESPPDN